MHLIIGRSTDNCMGALTHLFYPWGLFLQAAAIIHFIRRRPDTYWLYIILFLGPIGALVYLFAEVLPDAGLLNQSFKGISRGKRIRALELAILDNPSAGNYEELGLLYLDDGDPSRARAAFSFAANSASARNTRAASMQLANNSEISAISMVQPSLVSAVRPSGATKLFSVDSDGHVVSFPSFRSTSQSRQNSAADFISGYARVRKNVESPVKA